MHARGDDGQYLAVSLSAADEYVNMSVAELREMFVPALAALFPEAAAATVTEFFVTRERRATFRQVPGTARLRPKSATALPGLALAGAWTDTGWPDTMEGAVRSGLNAVIALHDQLEATPTAATPPAGLSGTNHEISGFVPVRGAGSEANNVLDADPVFEADTAVQEETVSEVNVTDEDEREVRS